MLIDPETRKRIEDLLWPAALKGDEYAIRALIVSGKIAQQEEAERTYRAALAIYERRLDELNERFAS